MTEEFSKAHRLPELSPDRSPSQASRTFSYAHLCRAHYSKRSADPKA
jgi:hypothetical protein